MLIYFLIFILCFLCSYVAEKSNEKRKAFFYIFSIMAIFIPSFIAGIRASGVGTDTKVYVDWVFRSNVFSKSFDVCINFIKMYGVEPLYCVVNFIVSRFTSNLSAIYFTIEFLILFFSFFGIRRISKRMNISSSFCYFIFLCLFFNKSLNLCRQFLAMSICLYSVEYIFTRNLKKYLLCMLIGIGFHNSVVLFFPLYFLYSITQSKSDTSFLFRVGIICTLLISVLFFKPLVELLVSYGVISNKYLNYVYLFGSSSNIKAIEFFSQLFILILCVFNEKKLVMKNQYNKFFIYLILLSFITFLFGFNAQFSQRISYYYSMFIIFIIPQIVNLYNNKKSRFIVMSFTLLLLFSYSYLYYAKYEFDQTVPYKIDVSSNKKIK